MGAQHGSGGGQGTPGLAEDLWATSRWWERESQIFLTGVTPDQLTRLQGIDSHLRALGKHKY